MSVIKLQVATPIPSVIPHSGVNLQKKRKLIAAGNIFTASDILNLPGEWGNFYSVAEMQPEYHQGLELLHKLSIRYNTEHDRMNLDERVQYRDIRESFFRKYPFGKEEMLYSRDWPIHFYPDVRVSEHSGDFLWPSITIKSVDQTVDRLYFFSMAEAEEALRLIEEGMNNV